MRTLQKGALAAIIALQSPVWAEAADQGDRTHRERARDRVVHIEPGIVREIPPVSRLCEDMKVKHRLNIGDCNLYCEQEGHGTPLVLISGGPGTTHHVFHPWFSQAAGFAQVIYYDPRGCGLSDYRPGNGYSVTQAVDDLERLRQVLGIGQWAVLGHSYGGLLAQCYAMKYSENVKAILLVGAETGLPGSSWPSCDQGFISQQEQRRIDEIGTTPELSMAQIVYNIHLNGDWKRQNYYKPTAEQIARSALYEWVHDAHFNAIMSSSASHVDFEGAFGRCPIPTLIVEGAWDLSWMPDKPERFHKNHPHARLVVFETSGHSPFEDEPERFFGMLGEFMGNLEQGSPAALEQWKVNLAQRSKDPTFFVKGLGWGHRSNQEIAAKYDRAWLDQIMEADPLLKIGLALYDLKRYEEALTVLEKVQEKAGKDPEQAAEALVWQGFMLDLLGRREDAVTRYRNAAGMNAQGVHHYDQFGLTFAPSPYARERIDAPFTRHQNFEQD